MNDDILKKTEDLTDLVAAMEPKLAGNYAGFEWSEETSTGDVTLLACGEERPLFQRPICNEISEQSRRGRACCLVISTDVSCNSSRRWRYGFSRDG